MAIAIFHGLAARDYRVALLWYARRSMRAAQRFKAAVDQVTQRIENNPQQGTPYLGRFWWVHVRKYPYIIYYEMVSPALVKDSRCRPCSPSARLLAATDAAMIP